MIFFFLVICFLSNSIKGESLAFITCQESNQVDVVNLESLSVEYSFKVGSAPAAIDIDTENKVVYVANPNSDNVSIINLKTQKVKNISANKSPLGVKFHSIHNKIIVSNWYDDTITIIDQSNQKKKTIKVGKSPAGIDIHPTNGQIVVANRDSNTINIIEDLDKKIITTIKVQKSPFGVFSNVQSNSISVIDFKSRKIIKNFKVKEWPYQVSIFSENNEIFVTNQRNDSVSIIDLQTYKLKNEINNICGYPEGLNINKRLNLIIIACWFDNEVVILDLRNKKVIKKIEVCEGPRSFGKFVID